MEDNVTQDALKLANKILNSLDPSDKSAIVNIALNKQGSDIVLVDNYSTIKKIFGYIHDKTPGFLEQHGVILAKTVGWWYKGITSINSLYNQTKPQEIMLDGNIDDVAHKNKYLSEDEIVEYYFHVPTEDIGPRIHGQMAILVNRKALESLINDKNNEVNIPSDRDYWYENQQLFLKLVDGGVDEFDFSKAEVSRKLFEAFYNLWKKDGLGNYKREDIVKQYKKLFKEDISANRFGEIISNVKASIINRKPLISDRIEWHFDKKNEQWVFKILTLKP